MGSSSRVRPTQPNWAALIVQMYLCAAGAQAGSPRDHHQRKTMDLRIMTYPTTITPVVGVVRRREPRVVHPVRPQRPRETKPPIAAP